MNFYLYLPCLYCQVGVKFRTENLHVILCSILGVRYNRCGTGRTIPVGVNKITFVRVP